MLPKVYVERFIRQAHDLDDAFVTVTLTEVPEEVCTRMAPYPGAVVTRAGSGEVVLSGTVRSVARVFDGRSGALLPWREALVSAVTRANFRLERPFRVGKWSLPWHERTLVMGILNVTPDSFSDGGKYNDVERAIQRARELVAAGADMIDVGGESTRPPGVYGQGAETVSAEEEKARVLPVISRLSRELDVPISVDTYKAEVAEAAIAHGAHIVNDVWGLKKDPQMAAVVARRHVPVVVMHNRERAQYERPLMREIADDLWESVAIAQKGGIKDEQMILDPGIGFGKTYEQNVEVMHRLEQIAYMGYPVLLGTSRKSLIGETLGLPVDERLEGTGATVAYGIIKGCRIVRVHDVKKMVRVCRMTDTLVRGKKIVG